MADLTLEQLQLIMPTLGLTKATLYLPYLNQAMDSGQLNTPQRQSAHIGQIALETNNFTWFAELWGPTPQQLKYDQPGPLATKLGNTQPGDGKAFKGHGSLQITGRYNTTLCGKALGVDFANHPELASTKEWAFKVGVWFWNTHKLNDLADLDTLDAYKAITHKINGGYNDLQKRVDYWTKARGVLGLPPL